MSLTEVIRNAIQQALSNTHTSLIARVERVNSSTVDVKPVNKIILGDGVEVELPVFLEVPILTIQGGGSSLSFPITAGDYALLVISESCIDNWWIGQDNSKPRELRTHDYSDAIAIVGLNNSKNPIVIPQKSTFQGDLIINGDLTVNGKILADSIETTGDIVVNGISFLEHIHTAPQGGGNTTPPQQV